MRTRNSLKGCQESGQASTKNCHLLTENPLGPRSPHSPSRLARGFLMKFPKKVKSMQELIFHSQCSLVAPGCTPPQTKGWNLRTERFENTIVFFGSWKPWYFAGSLSLFLGGHDSWLKLGRSKNSTTEKQPLLSVDSTVFCHKNFSGYLSQCHPGRK